MTLSLTAPLSGSSAFADSNSVNVVTQAFKDVPTNYPWITGINFVASQGIMNGYPDGTFQPNENLTRAELAVTLVHLMGDDLEAQSNANQPTGFTDDNSIQSWSRGAINFLINKGIIHGYPDGSFRPQGKLEQTELLAVLVNLLGYPTLYSNLGWPNQYIKAAGTLYITDRVPVDLNSLASRGITAQLIYNEAILASGDDLTDSPDPTFDSYRNMDPNSTESKLTMALGLYGQNYIQNRLPASFMGVVTNFSSNTVTITNNIDWPQPSLLGDSWNSDVTFTYGNKIFLDTTESKDSIQSLNGLQIGSFITVVLGRDGSLNYVSASNPLPMNLPTQNPSPSPVSTPPPLTGTISSDDTGNRIFLSIRLVGPNGASQPFQAILDTGGDNGGFPQSILEQVGYTPISQTLLSGAGGSGQTAYVYQIQYPQVLDNGQWVPLGKGSMITIGYDDVLDHGLSPMVPPTIFKNNSGLSLTVSGSNWTMTFPSP